MLADYILSVRDRGLSLSTMKVHKSAICMTIRCGGGPNHAADATIQALLQSISARAPPKRPSMPKWNLNIVLGALCKSPFEPLDEADVLHLSYKTAFLIAWGTASRRSELHALCMDGDHLKWGKDGAWVDLTAGMEFMAKNQRAQHPPRRFRLQALERRDPEGGEEPLCPVRALRLYLAHTKAYRGEQTRLFLRLNGTDGAGVSSQTLAKWIRETIRICYKEAAPQQVADTQGCHAHELRAVAASLAVAHHKPVREVMAAAFWRSESCFSTFYLKDMAKVQSGSPTGLSTFAAGFSLDI